MGNALMSADADKVLVAIGVLKSELSNLAEKFDDLNERTTREQRSVHDIVVATSDAMRNVVRTVENLTRTVDEMKPLTDDYREKRAEKRGEERYKNWLYGVIASLGGGIALVMSKLLEWVTTRPHIPAIAVLSITLYALAAKAWGQDHRHHPAADMPIHEKFYQGWHMPDQPDKSCCNKADCYPTEVTYREGVLFAKRREDGKWLRIPAAKIERHRENPDGRNHLCAPPPNAVAYPSQLSP